MTAQTGMLHGMKNHKKQGNVGLGRAIAYFTEEQWTVCVPLTDSQAYDLIVEKDGTIARVQVKTSRCAPKKAYQVSLRTSCLGIHRPFDRSLVELVFILTNDGSQYVIPAEVIKAEHIITVPGLYAQYRTN